MIYLDNAATTQIASEVLEEMIPYLTTEYGNAGALYKHGRNAAGAVAKAREQVARFIGASPEQIIFTSSGSEANNLAICGSRRYLSEINKKHIITSEIEHESLLKAVEALCNPLAPKEKNHIKQEFYASYLPVYSFGSVNTGTLEEMIREDTGLISVMYRNNEIGSRNNVKEIGEICQMHDILFHTDCVQAAGGEVLNVDEIGCDLLSLSAHKIHGPKGVGALYVRDKKYLSPIINGGKGQEFGLRSGTENVAGIVGFGKACELMGSTLDMYICGIVNQGEIFYKKLMSELAKYGLEDYVQINGSPFNMGRKVQSFRFDGVDAETLVLMMDKEGVCISAGAACSSRELSPSHVLKAIGLSDEEARSTVRISFSGIGRESEIIAAAEKLAYCVNSLKNK